MFVIFCANAHFERVEKVISIHFMLGCHFPFRWVWCFCLISFCCRMLLLRPKRMDRMCSAAHALSFPILLNGFTFLILVEMRFAIAYAWELVANILMILLLAYMVAHSTTQPNSENSMHQTETYVLMIICWGSKMIPVVHAECRVSCEIRRHHSPSFRFN